MEESKESTETTHRNFSDDSFVDWNDLTSTQQNKVKLILPKRRIKKIGMFRGFVEENNGIYISSKEEAHESSSYSVYHGSATKTTKLHHRMILTSRWQWTIESTSRFKVS